MRTFLPVAALLAFLALAGAHAEEGEREPPFITTPPEVVERMLELAGTGSGDLVVDLGSGDGRIAIIAARRFGARGHGIELDAALVEKSRANALRAGVADRVSFEHGDVLRADISRATVVTVYLLPSLIDKLQPRFVYELRPGTRIVSHAFSMAGWRPDASVTVRLSRPHPGQGDESSLYLWVVPAQARGRWEGGPDGERWRLQIHQNYQEIELEGTVAGKPAGVRGAKLSGDRISWEAAGGRFLGRVEGSSIVGQFARGGVGTPLVLRRVR
jgi:precorrin-6B methylase 2